MSSTHLTTVRKWLLQSPPIEWADLRLRDLLIGALSQGPVPQHIAMVMDGNRRYARKKRIEIAEGHNMGFEAMAQMLEVCYRCGVKVMTVYAFSVENFSRSRYEVDSLMALMKLKLMQMSEHGELFERYGARVRVLGQRELLAPDVLEAIDRAEGITKDNTDAILNVCFPYISRNEITMAIRNTVEDWLEPVGEREWAFSQSRIEQSIRSRNLSNGTVKLNGQSPSPSAISDTEDSTVESIQPATPPNFAPPTAPKPNTHLSFSDPETIDSRTLDEHMYTAGLPPVDLLIRTSGVERLSDYLLWQVHEKTDIKFVDCMWPEFDLWHFIPVLVEWQWRQRKRETETKLVRRRGRKVAIKVQ